MFLETELRQAIADILPVPMNGPFSRFVPFDKMVARETPMITPTGPVFNPVDIPQESVDFTWKVETSPGVVVSGTGTFPVQPRPLWGIGSILHGGRYNKPHSFEVVYLAEDPITALTEVDRVFAPHPASARIKGPPLVYISVDGILGSTLDLTAKDIQQSLATSHQELTGAWIIEQDSYGEAPTQRLGRIAFESKRFCALRYPSAKNKGGVCLAVFPDRLSGPSHLAVFDPFGNLAQRLPAEPR